MRYLILTLLTVFIFFRTTGQNLIANSSFEEANTCEEHRYLCCPEAWFSVCAKPDGYKIEKARLLTPQSSYLSLLVASRSTGMRQYWQTKLLCTLHPGATYKISLKVKTPRTDPRLSDIGFYFTDSLLFFQRDTLLHPRQYINFSDAQYNKLENGWQLWEKEFTAEEAKSFLVIGNFSGQSNNALVQQRNLQNIFIYIDDVSIISQQHTMCNNDSLKVKEALYAYKKRHSPFDKLNKMQAIETKPELKIDTLIIPNILFAFNSYHLKDSSIISILNPMLRKSNIEKIMIIGFTDNVGSEQYNLELSKKRADEIANILTVKYKIPASIINTEGKGISSDYAKPEHNRRVEIYLYRIL